MGIDKHRKIEYVNLIWHLKKYLSQQIKEKILSDEIDNHLIEIIVVSCN